MGCDPNGGPWSSAQLDTLQAARGLLRSEGEAGLTVARLAEVTGKSKAALYRHFPSLQQLRTALRQLILREHFAAPTASHVTTSVLDVIAQRVREIVVTAVHDHELRWVFNGSDSRCLLGDGSAFLGIARHDDGHLDHRFDRVVYHNISSVLGRIEGPSPSPGIDDEVRALALHLALAGGWIEGPVGPDLQDLQPS